MKILRFLLSLACLLGLFFLFDNRFAQLPYLKEMKALQDAPALGHFFNPFGGFWTNAETKELPKSYKLNLPELQDKVEVLFDDRLVPHIFAKNENDLFFAQGFVTAKLRLWQMEFQTHAAAGRISEIFGSRALAYDRQQRRTGMVLGAENALKAIREDPQIQKVLDAYTAGINAYIASLSPADYPVEYKILSYAPEPWTNLKTTLLLKYMARTLSFRSHDLSLTRVLHDYGPEVIKELYANYPKNQDPVVPPDTKFNFKAKKIPSIPKQVSVDSIYGEVKKVAPDMSGIGSNNWAVNGEKAAGSYPILSNDPHLTLSLPSIWFEIQLVGPKINVYGASLPGAPGVISGFNREVSWGVTNVGADVIDWYQITFADPEQKTYVYGDTVREISYRIEEIKIRDSLAIQDTILMTHYGPIVALEEDSVLAKQNGYPIQTALRWIAHEPSNEARAVYELNKARNYRDYRRALEHFECPGQNFVYADVHGDIAITSSGKYPVRWEGQGQYILDGSNPDHEWGEFFPFNQNPHIRNPERGFVSSANQFPVVDSLYPYYLDWKFADYSRGKRINERLAEMEEITMDSLQALQNDNLNLFARDMLPLLLSKIDSLPLNESETQARDLLRRWDYRFEAESVSPSIYEAWWGELFGAIWDDEFEKGGYIYPSRDQTRNLILKNDTASVRWIDNVNTPEKERLSDIIALAYQRAISQLETDHGPLGSDWNWSNVRNTTIKHLIPNFNSFSTPKLNGGGHKLAVNALSARQGPSWRMVVQLGRTPQARVIYPGGQSGNPGSFYYDQFVQDWAQGKLAEALFLKSSQSKNKRIISRLKLSK